MPPNVDLDPLFALSNLADHYSVYSPSFPGNRGSDNSSVFLHRRCNSLFHYHFLLLLLLRLGLGIVYSLHSSCVV